MPPAATARPLLSLFFSIFYAGIYILPPIVCHFVFLPMHFKDLKPSVNGEGLAYQQIGGKKPSIKKESVCKAVHVL